MPAETPAVLPYFVTNYVACGDARLVFLFLDPETNAVVSAPDRTAEVAFYDLANDPDTPVATEVGEFVWAIPDQRGMYIVNVELPTAGEWGAEITTSAPGSAEVTSRMRFEVHDSSPVVAVGDKAPATDTPTLEDVGGDIAKLSTDDRPESAFYETSVTDALAAHEPFVIAFATPKFCTSAQCGPTIDRLKPIARAHPDVTFINVEPYLLEYSAGGLQPVLDGQGQLQATDVTDTWGLLSEPWVFVVDGDGIIRGSFEGVLGDEELEAAIVEVSS